MALSDRIALLRNGALEQVASPREIYARPLTAYTAQFIGQTNLLRGEVRRGRATCGAIGFWPAEGPDGPATFSLRPEAIGIPESAGRDGRMRFRGTVVDRTFGGSTEVLEIDCGGQRVRARVPATGPPAGGEEFVFDAADAIRVRDP